MHFAFPFSPDAVAGSNNGTRPECRAPALAREHGDQPSKVGYLDASEISQ